MKISQWLIILFFSSYYMMGQETEELSITIEAVGEDAAKRYIEELMQAQEKKKMLFEIDKQTQEEYDLSKKKFIKKKIEGELTIEKLSLDKIQEVKEQIEFFQESNAVLDFQQEQIIIEEKEKDSIIQEDPREIPAAVIGTKSVNPSKQEITFGSLSNNKRLRGPSQFDSRIEVHQLDPEIDWQLYMLINRESVGMIIEKDRLYQISNEYYQIRIDETLKNRFNLCDQIPFGQQPSIGLGTAFIVDKNKMITANHVLGQALTNYAIIFDFEISNSLGVVDRIIHESNIFFPTSKDNTLDDLDITVFKVNKTFDRIPLAIGDSKSLKNNHEVYMIGYPAGIPKKLTVNAGVIENKHKQYFYTSLDGFQGNSGSPVFDFYNNKVIGVIVSGGLDYTYTGDCYELNVCSLPECKGEKIIRIESIFNEF